MEYMMKNMFGLRWNCKELKRIMKLRFFELVTMILQWLSNLKRKQTRTAWSTQQCMKSEVTKHLGVAGIQHENGLVDETNVKLFAKVRCFLIHSGMSMVFWAEDTTRSTYRVNRSPSSAIGFKRPIDMLGVFCWLASIKQGMLEMVKVSGEYKKTFIGSGVGTGSMQVLHGFEFEMEPLRDHTFEVELHENVDQGAGLQEVQTQDVGDYQLARDREQHLACELFGYIEDSNGAAFAVAAVKKINAHKSLTINNTVDCEVAGKAVTTTMAITGSIHQGHSTLSLKDSLSGDCDVKMNGKWSYIYAVGSQEYQVVCTRPDIASAGVDMFDGFYRGLQTYAYVFVDFDYVMGRSITVMSRSITWYGLMILGCAESLKANLQHIKALSTTEATYMMFAEARKKEIWLKGLLTESGYDLWLVACIATGALVKGCSRSEVPAQVKVAAYRY
uniref:Zinc finger, CCHC-type n=1 Tax=Tanacetum cinerariifolium TaxID=118510 RepID=A0A6L2MLM8_TANCI|nr:zinc finger, CCHC-type [Tanacetum cinerariifolium]